MEVFMRKIEIFERLSELRVELGERERDLERIFGGCFGWESDESYVFDFERGGVGVFVRGYLRVREEIEELRRELVFRS
jgi:hypothetical protein